MFQGITGEDAYLYEYSQGNISEGTVTVSLKDGDMPGLPLGLSSRARVSMGTFLNHPSPATSAYMRTKFYGTGLSGMLAVGVQELHGFSQVIQSTSGATYDSMVGDLVCPENTFKREFTIEPTIGAYTTISVRGAYIGFYWDRREGAQVIEYTA